MPNSEEHNLRFASPQYVLDKRTDCFHLLVTLPGIQSSNLLELDIAPCCIRLQAPRFAALCIDLPEDVDISHAHARWHKNSYLLEVRTPFAYPDGWAGGKMLAKCAGVCVGELGGIASGGRSFKTTKVEVARCGELFLAPGVFDPSHGSSKLMMDWICSTAKERGWLEGREVLDYGCGSGALGLCALVQGSAHSVVFVDLSREALAVTQANANCLGLSDRVSVRLPPTKNLDKDFDDFFDYEEQWRSAAATLGENDVKPLLVGSEPESQRFGVILVNMRKNALLRCAPHLVQLCRPDGVVAVSGFMTNFEEPVVLQAFRNAGLQCNVDLNALHVADMGDFRADVHDGYGIFWGSPCA